MRKIDKFWFILFIFGIFSILYNHSNAAIGTLSLSVQGIGIRHGTPNSISIGAIQASASDQVLSGRFEDFFRVEDLLGSATGHYTTIQCDGLRNGNGSTITGIYIKAGNINPSYILGMSGNVLISNDLNDYKSINQPIIYIHKPSSPQSAGIINKYGDIPYIKVNIPAFTPPGSYSGVIIYTLYSY